MNPREAIYPAAIILLTIIFFYARLYKTYAKRSLSKEAKEYASKAYGLFRTNNRNGGIYAICTFADLEIGHIKFLEVCKDWPIGKRPKDNYINAIPTFTFTMNQSGETGNHAGNFQDCNDLVDDIIEIITGVHPRNMLNNDYIQVRDQIFISDYRLFVPFSSGINPLIRQWEKKVYKNNNLEYAQEYLLSAAADLKERILSHAQK